MSAELGVDFENYADLMFSIANGIVISEEDFAKLVKIENSTTATHTAPSNILDASNLVVYKSPAGVIKIFGANQQKQGFLVIDNSYARVSPVPGPIVTANLGLPLSNGCIVRLTHEIDRTGSTEDTTSVFLTDEIAIQLLRALGQKIDPKMLNNWEIRLTEEDDPIYYMVGTVYEKTYPGMQAPPREVVIEVEKELLHSLGIEGFPFALTTVGTTNLVRFNSAYGVVNIACSSKMPDPKHARLNGLPLIPARVRVGDAILL
jgi:hypothetical protein